MWAFIIYLWDIVDSINVLTALLAVGFGVCIIISGTIFTVIYCEPDRNKHEKRIMEKSEICLFNFIKVFFVLIFVNIVTPSSDTVKLMVAASISQDVYEGIALEGYETIPQDLLDITKGFIEQVKEDQSNE